MVALVPAPEGFKFTGDYRRPEKGDYWLSFSALFSGHVLSAGPHHFDKRKGNWWPKDDLRIILEKIV